MRKFRVHIETPFAGQEITDVFEMPEDATEEEIQDVARDMFFNHCNYGVEELKEENKNDK